MTRLDRALLMVSYLLLVAVTVWTAVYFTGLLGDIRRDRCAADLASADLQILLADPPADPAVQDQARALRDQIAGYCTDD